MSATLESDILQLSPGAYLPLDTLTHTYDRGVVGYKRNNTKYADVVDLAAKMAYDDYLAAETERSAEVFGAAVKAASEQRSVADAAPYMVPLGAYREEKLAYVAEYGPHICTVDEQTGAMISEPLKFANLARFQNGHERPAFAPLVFAEPYQGDKLVHKPVEAGKLAVAVATLWSCDQWLSLAREWVSQKVSNLRVRVHLGGIALAD